MKTSLIFLSFTVSVVLADAATQLRPDPDKPTVIMQDYIAFEGGATVNAGTNDYIYAFSRNNIYFWTSGKGGVGLKVIEAAKSDVTGWWTFEGIYQMLSPASASPVIAAGTNWIIENTAQNYGTQYGSHETNQTSWTPDLFWEHANVKQLVSKGIGYPASFEGSWFDPESAGMYYRTADARLVLKTGGKALSHRQTLYMLTASATNILDKLSQPQQSEGVVTWTGNGETQNVPSTSITIGQKALGSDGKLWMVMPDNTTNDVTPVVKGSDFYTFTMDQQQYVPIIKANNIALDPVEVNVTNIVGQVIDFTLDGIPTEATKSQIQWNFDGHWFNDQSNAVPGVEWPECSAVPFTNISLLTQESSTDNWWVSGGTNQPFVYQANLSEHLTFTNGQYADIQVSGKFGMWKPMAMVTTQTGQVSVNQWTTNGLLYLRFGDTNTPGITFFRTVSMPTNFGGGFFWTQIVNVEHYTRQLSSYQYQWQTGQGLDNEVDYGDDGVDKTVDSPGAPLEPNTLEYNALSNSFTMWLMFDAGMTNSHAVPLRAVNWYWQGSATNGPSGWVIEGGTTSHSINPPSFPTEEYPYWTDNVTNYNVWHDF